jgi:hypothetical protein
MKSGPEYIPLEISYFFPLRSVHPHSPCKYPKRKKSEEAKVGELGGYGTQMRRIS